MTNSIFHNHINSQLDATITVFIDNYNQLNMFRAIIPPILKSDAVYSLWYNAPAMLPAGDNDEVQLAKCFFIPQAVNTV